jgi:hypothetical protein
MDLSPQEFNEQLRAGFVSREGFRRLWDAECYGNVSSLGALKSWLRDLERPLRAGKRIEIEGERLLSTRSELIAWVKEKFPEAYSCFYKDSDNISPDEHQST